MSLQRFLIDKMLRLRVKRRLKRHPDVLELRPMMAEMARWALPPPMDIRIDRVELGGVPVERLSPLRSEADAAIFYIHGGAWVAGSPQSHRALLWRLAKAAGMPVHAVDYRLAPEHPFPAALDDVTLAYLELSKRLGAKRIVVGGDSSGGNLALCLMLNLTAKNEALPAALFCLSPPTDLAAHGGSLVSNGKSDALFVPEITESASRHYCPGRPLTDPLISPLRGDLSRLPPTLIQVAANEMLRDQSVDLAAELRKAKVPVELEVWPKVWHVWHLSADMLPEARIAISKLAEFSRRHLLR